MTVKKVLKDSKVRRAPADQRELLERTVPSDQQVQMVVKDPLVLLDQQAERAVRVVPVVRVLLDPRDHKDKLVMLDLQDDLVRVEALDLLARVAGQDLQDQVDQQALRVNVVKQEKLENQARTETQDLLAQLVLLAV